MCGAILMVVVLVQAPAEVCLTELYEIYDYDYLSDEDTYGEKVVWAWTVEERVDLPNDVVGWRHLGFIRSIRIIWYGSDDETIEAWWADEKRKGTVDSVEDAVGKLLRGKEFEIKWR